MWATDLQSSPGLLIKNTLPQPSPRLNLRGNICNILNINTEAISEKYLGLLTLVGATKVIAFLHLLEMILQRLMGWKDKLLSIVGILLKTVAQSILVLTMSVFKLPKGVCKSINDAMARFWWGDYSNGRKIYSFSWWKL